MSKTTIGMRMGHLSAFFSRIIEWEYPDAPARPPVFSSDRTIKDKPLPRFLEDAATAKFLAAARGLADRFGRLAIEILARTGMRKGELLGPTVDAIVQIGSAYWLRVPLGKLHNDRYIPLHPQLKTMIDAWLADRPNWQDSPLLFTDRGRPIPGTRVDHAVRQAATAAGIGHVHASHSLDLRSSLEGAEGDMCSSWMKVLARLGGERPPSTTTHPSRFTTPEVCMRRRRSVVPRIQIMEQRLFWSVRRGRVAPIDSKWNSTSARRKRGCLCDIGPLLCAP